MKVVLINLVDAPPDKLSRAVGQAIEHLGRVIEVMNRAEHEIEFVPILFDPFSSGTRSLRIVIELDAGTDFQIGIRGAQFIDFIEIDSGMETIVIGKRNIVQTARARTVDPRLQEFSRIALNAMSLRMGMIIAEKFHGGSSSPLLDVNLGSKAAFV